MNFQTSVTHKFSCGCPFFTWSWTSIYTECFLLFSVFFLYKKVSRFYQTFPSKYVSEAGKSNRNWAFVVSCLESPRGKTKQKQSDEIGSSAQLAPWPRGKSGYAFNLRTAKKWVWKKKKLKQRKYVCKAVSPLIDPRPVCSSPMEWIWGMPDSIVAIPTCGKVGCRPRLTAHCP